MISNDWSQKRTAEKLGISTAHVSRIKAGTHEPSPALANLINSRVSEPETPYGSDKKTAEHPLKLAICGYCDLMTEQQLLDEVTHLQKLFSGEQTPEKS